MDPRHYCTGQFKKTKQNESKYQTVFTVLKEEGPFVMPSYIFKLTASKNEWLKFLQSTPQPGSHDIIAMLRRKVLKFEGDLHPLMSHLLYFKLLLASLRPTESNRES